MIEIEEVRKEITSTTNKLKNLQSKLKQLEYADYIIWKGKYAITDNNEYIIIKDIFNYGSVPIIECIYLDYYFGIIGSYFTYVENKQIEFTDGLLTDWFNGLKEITKDEWLNRFNEGIKYASVYVNDCI